MALEAGVVQDSRTWIFTGQAFQTWHVYFEITFKGSLNFQKNTNKKFTCTSRYTMCS
jgi:hypothetical protein